jgi:2-methylisocitrate lyase-like PEP mutase family enzyme
MRTSRRQADRVRRADGDKIRAAAAERTTLFIVARTDARSVVHGKRFGAASSICALEPMRSTSNRRSSGTELEQCGRAFRALNMTSMLEGGKTPILKPSELYAMGFNIVIYGILVAAHHPDHAARTEDLKSERLELVGSGVSFDAYMRIVGPDRWSAIERQFDVERADADLA